MADILSIYNIQRLQLCVLQLNIKLKEKHTNNLKIPNDGSAISARMEGVRRNRLHFPFY